MNKCPDCGTSIARRRKCFNCATKDQEEMEKNMGNVLGCDPGQTGALVLMSPQRKILAKYVLPKGVDGHDLVELRAMLEDLKLIGIKMACLEEVHAIYGCSAGATFSFGRGFGQLEAMLACMQIPYTMVKPKTWQKAIHVGFDLKMKAKEKSRLMAQRIFPGERFLATGRSKVPHDGLIDAALLAFFGIGL